jgi:hypothetical protein
MIPPTARRTLHVLVASAALGLGAFTPVDAQANPPEPIADAEPASPDVRGHWLGVITAGAQSVRLGLSIHADDGQPLAAQFRQIDPTVTERTVSSIAFDGTTIRFALTTPSVTYSGTFQRDPDRLEGTWTQRGINYPLVFERVAALPGTTRPQEPDRPLPYLEEQVRIEPAPGVVLAGTLTKPSDPAKHPAVVLLSGSGAQDRDESAFGHRPFLVLADMLTRRGFAVLRLDDRGIGGSTGDVYQATLTDLAGDAVAAVEFLARHPDIDAARISIAGHSEGGLVAALAAARSPHVSRVAMLATPLVPVRELRAAQTLSIGRSMSASDAVIEAIREFNRRAFDAAEAGLSGQALNSELTQAGRSLLASIPEAERPHYAPLAQQLVATAAGYSTPWFRSLLALDPGATLNSVRCPVLVVLGAKDVQVDAEPSRRAAEASLYDEARAASRVVVMPAMNHMLQSARTGALSEYVLIDETISPVVLDTLAEWLTPSK